MFLTLKFKNIQEKKKVTSQVLVNEHKFATKDIYVVAGNYIKHFLVTLANMVLNSSILKLAVLGFVIILIIAMLLTYHDVGDILVQLSSSFSISLKNNKRSTIVHNKIRYNVTLNRTMLRYVLRNSPTSLAIQTRDMSCLRGVKFTKKMPQNMINDNNTAHTHVVKEKCVIPDCDIKKCPSLCDDFKEGDIKGHQTHKPPIGRMARYISAEDANGEKKQQYKQKIIMIQVK